MDNILYHCSFQAVERFVLRVPEYRCPGEDAKTPRVCFAENIKDAVTAMPQGGQALRGMISQKKFFPILHIYSCDRTKQTGSFIPPWTLNAPYGVFDALSTGEWWAVERNPEMTHEIHLVEEAQFAEVADQHRKTVVVVESIRTMRLDSLPNNAAETVLLREIPDIVRQYGVRTVFREYDEMYVKEVQCW